MPPCITAPAPAQRAPFPGLARLFHVQLWLSMLFSLSGGLYLLYRFVELGHGGSLALAACGLFLLVYCVLLAWAEHALRNQTPAAPERCKAVLWVNMGAAVVALVTVLVLYFIVPSGLHDVVTPLWGILSSLVICETWRQYFSYSPNVHAAFAITLTAYEQQQAANVPPAEIGIFMALCWLLICETLPRLVWFSAWNRLPLWIQWGVALHAMTAIVLPLIALYQLKQRNGLKVIFWCLGLWLAVRLLNDITYEYIYMFSPLSARQTFPLLPIQTHLTADILLPLVYWWYFATSTKGRTWCGVPQLQEDKPCIP